MQENYHPNMNFDLMTFQIANYVYMKSKMYEALGEYGLISI